MKKQVYLLTRQIPKGSISTYGRLAKAAGRPSAYRAVGNILHMNLDPASIPCHRVINSNGKVGEYMYGKTQKIRLLASEGIEIVDNRVVNFELKLFDDFKRVPQDQ